MADLIHLHFPLYVVLHGNKQLVQVIVVIQSRTFHRENKSQWLLAPLKSSEVCSFTRNDCRSRENVVPQDWPYSFTVQVFNMNDEVVPRLAIHSTDEPNIVWILFGEQMVLVDLDEVSRSTDRLSVVDYDKSTNFFEYLEPFIYSALFQLEKNFLIKMYQT